MKSHYVMKREYTNLEAQKPGSLYTHTLKGMQTGTLSIQELRQIGLVAKNTLYDSYGFDLPTPLSGYSDQLLRLVMASLLPTAQAIACMTGLYWQVDREVLKRACIHSGQYHEYLYTIIEQLWCLRVCPPVWTTEDVRALRKSALKAYKASPSAATARVVAVSLLPPAEAQTLMEAGGHLTPAQLRTATHRAPSPTYERAVAEYADALENA